mmetsp:Transcript_6979/g.12509  ORF Transcript_6979/g.12509 Transcript_6979/m.12509 type:complete len:120 (-) Transcript_6979:180-539(-)
MEGGGGDEERDVVRNVVEELEEEERPLLEESDSGKGNGKSTGEDYEVEQNRLNTARILLSFGSQTMHACSRAQEINYARQRFDLIQQLAIKNPKKTGSFHSSTLTNVVRPSSNSTHDQT